MSIFLIQSCKDDPKTDADSNATNADSLALANDSTMNSFEDQELSSKEDVEKLVGSEDVSRLNEYQKFAQEFIAACGKKDYPKVAKYLAYKGDDYSRVNITSFNYSKANEKNTVKVTADVIYNFLAESKNYEFISYNERMDGIGKVHVLEITFFKKGKGMNRRFIELIDTKNGLLIHQMR